MDASYVITFDPDHTFSVWREVLGHSFIDCHGSWRIEGDTIIRDIIYPRPDLHQSDPTHVREPIISLTATTLRVKALGASGIDIFEYVRGERPPKAEAI